MISDYQPSVDYISTNVTIYIYNTRHDSLTFCSINKVCFLTLITLHMIYPKATIICRYICLRFELKAHFACTIFCDLYAKIVQGRLFLMFSIVHN